jgi:hypothetical protein
VAYSNVPGVIHEGAGAVKSRFGVQLTLFLVFRLGFGRPPVWRRGPGWP